MDDQVFLLIVFDELFLLFVLFVLVCLLVFVVILVYGKCEYIVVCLCLLVWYGVEVLFEMIVVDDVLLDDIVEVFIGVQGLWLVRNCENFGFIDSCNVGVVEVCGEYLVFFNNDIQVMFGWMDVLL